MRDDSFNLLTDLALIQRKSSSVQLSLGALSIRKMATHIVVGLTGTAGLHFTAMSWRKLGPAISVTASLSLGLDVSQWVELYTMSL